VSACDARAIACQNEAAAERLGFQHGVRPEASDPEDSDQRHNRTTGDRHASAAALPK
jgi:hypothetical protein